MSNRKISDNLLNALSALHANASGNWQGDRDDMDAFDPVHGHTTYEGDGGFISSESLDADLEFLRETYQALPYLIAALREEPKDV